MSDFDTIYNFDNIKDDYIAYQYLLESRRYHKKYDKNDFHLDYNSIYWCSKQQFLAAGIISEALMLRKKYVSNRTINELILNHDINISQVLLSNKLENSLNHLSGFIGILLHPSNGITGESNNILYKERYNHPISFIRIFMTVQVI